MRPLEAGEDTVGPYRLLGRLGAGGMGRVYLARSSGGRTVAVKVVHAHFAADEQFRARFRREVDSARRVGTGPGGHRWSAPVLDADPDAAVPWVATGYVAGPPLSQAVAAHGPLPERSVRALGAGLAEALTAVHGLGLVHRDVKPSNVLLALDGPRLIDFGIARATDGTTALTSTGASVGSPGYMPPEQILGRSVAGPADVFSLGAVLAFASTGAGPFPGDSPAALLYRVVHGEPELGGLRGDLRDLVTHCLAKDPAARPGPAEIARRLAPEGAERLTAGGWLPGALVEEVSRAAVRLLDLDAGRPLVPPDPPAPTGPVPFTTPSTGDDTHGRTDTAGPGGPAPHGAGSAPPALGAFGPPDAPPEEAAPPGPPRPGGPLSLSLTAHARPGAGGGGGERRDGRKVSCTVVLSTAAALAVVTVGGAFFAGLFGDQDRFRDSASGRPSSSASAPADTASPPQDGDPSASAGPPAPSGSGDSAPRPSRTPAPGPTLLALPKAFLGTWKGRVTERGGAPHGDYTARFGAGEKGEDVVRTTSHLSLLGVEVNCYSVGRLVSATDRQVRVEERLDPERAGAAGLCTDSVARLTFTLGPDGTLRYESDEEGAGRPAGTLVKQ